MRHAFHVTGRLAGGFMLFTSLAARGATLLSDDFNDGNANGWTVVKDSSDAPAWQAVNGGYRQANDVRGYVQSFHSGSYAFNQSGLNFTDYEVSVHLAPVSTHSVGVMFRYTNTSNYYRFTINRNQGFSRLEKRVNGSFTTLAFDGRGPDFSQPHVVTINVLGSNILVYLDGEALLSAQDTSLTTGTVGLFAQGNAVFDDVVVNTTSAASALIISRPVSYSVETSGALDVAAVAKGVPTGGGVRFTLDNGVSFTDKTSPYAGKFSAVAAGDHLVSAVIVNGAGLALPSPLAQETNAVVGARGRYFVAMGDSITVGAYDDVAGDDDSSDGRNVSHGFTPILNDLLTAQLGLPVTVLNEGQGGTTSGTGGRSGASRINSTKLRHTESQYWLIMFGTNDSKRPIRSGKGLLPGASGYSGSFKDAMQRIITSLKQSNKIPILAKVPFIRNAPVSQDRLIQDYNLVIDELVAANAITVTPPDFYGYFKQNPGQLPDNIHPNGAGYQAMANLWFQSLAGSGILN
ncbi:MAG: SGNH/GDSL hydrolase family protein [Gammaproteobacteria bacterium]